MAPGLVGARAFRKNNLQSKEPSGAYEKAFAHEDKFRMSTILLLIPNEEELSCFVPPSTRCTGSEPSGFAPRTLTEVQLLWAHELLSCSLAGRGNVVPRRIVGGVNTYISVPRRREQSMEASPREQCFCANIRDGNPAPNPRSCGRLVGLRSSRVFETQGR